MKEIENLMMLYKHDYVLTGLLIEGLVTESIKELGELDNVFKFYISKYTHWEIKYIILRRSWNIPKFRRKLKRGKEARENGSFTRYKKVTEFQIVNEIALRSFKYELTNHVKLLNTKPSDKDAVYEYKCRNFKLVYYTSIKKYSSSDSDIYTRCKLYVKYKKSNCKKPIFDMAFNAADGYPRKNKYVKMLEFNVNEMKPDVILTYLHRIIDNYGGRTVKNI